MIPEKSPRPTAFRILTWERVFAFLVMFAVLAFGIRRVVERLSTSYDGAHVSGLVAIAAVWVAIAICTSE